jgi:ComF family protein
MLFARRLLSPLAPPLCCACGAHAGPLEPLCRSCRLELRWLPRSPLTLGGVDAWAPLAYQGPARAVVRELKFRGRVRVAEAMAAQVVATAPPDLLCAGVTLVPVPLHPRRARKRGFNQAERLAGAVALRTGASVRSCLVRVGSASTQMGRARGERLMAMKGNVAVAPGASVPSFACLVDDVITTGATLAACAAALRAAGAERVIAIAYARTPGR